MLFKERHTTRRAFVAGGVSSAVLFPFAASAAGGAAKLTDFALGKGPSISFALETADGQSAAGWRVFAVPKRACLFREIRPDSSFPFPWDSAAAQVRPVELKPVRKTGGRLEFSMPVPDAKDWSALYTFRGVLGDAATEPADASIAYLAKAAGAAGILAKAKTAYFSQGTDPVPMNDEWRLGMEKAYRMKETGTVVVEIDIEGAGKGAPVEIVAWGDNHLKLANDEDRKSDNIMAAFERRGKANPPEKGSQSLEREMELVPFFDGAAILGDNVDFFSYGSFALWKRMMLDVSRDPLVVIGYHDYVTHTINKRPQKEMPESFTMPVCRRFMPNDVHYATKLAGGRVLMIGMDASKNGNFYWETGIHEKLAADVARARAKGWTVLLFQHEGQYLNTWTGGRGAGYDLEADRKICERRTMTGSRAMNYQNFANILNDPKKAGYSQARGTKAVYDIVWNNADVIRGVFHGHVHANYASWIRAKTPSGEEKPIPQYSCCGSVFFDDGWIFRINVR